MSLERAGSGADSLSTHSEWARASKRRPRSGEWWRNRETGDIVWVAARRTVHPLADVRPHSGLRWSLVLYSKPGTFFGTEHEADFVKEYEFHA